MANNGYKINDIDFSRSELEEVASAQGSDFDSYVSELKAKWGDKFQTTEENFQPGPQMKQEESAAVDPFVTEAQTQPTVSESENGSLGYQDTVVKDADEPIYIFKDGAEYAESELLASLKNLDIKLTGKESSDIYDFKDGKAYKVKSSISNEKLLDSYFNRLQSKPIKSYKGGQLDEVVITADKTLQRAEKIINEHKPTEDDFYNIENNANNLFVPISQLPDKIQTNAYFYAGPTQPAIKDIPDGYMEYKERAKKVIGDDNASEDEILEEAKKLYIKDKKTSAHADKIANYARQNPLKAKGLANASAIIDSKKREAFSKKEKESISIGSEANSVISRANLLLSSSYANKEEARVAKEEYDYLLNLSGRLSMKYADNRSDLINEAMNIDNNSLILDVVKRSYDVPTIAVANVAATSADLLAGALRVPEWITVSIASAVSGADPMLVRSGLRTASVPGGPTFAPIMDTASGLEKISSDLRANVAKPIEIQDIKTLGDFGYWATDLTTNQLPNIALMVVAPEIALPIMSASAAGSKYQGMMTDIELYGKKYNGWQLIAAPAIVGAAEYISESISLGQLKAVKNVFKGKNDVLKAATQYVEDNVLSYKGIKDLTGESIGEGGVTLAENIVDIYMLDDKQKHVWDGVPNAMASGLFISGVLFKSPVIGAKMLAPFAANDTSQRVRENLAMLNKISIELRKDGLSDNIRESLKAKQFKIENSNVSILSEQYSRIDDLSEVEKARLIDIDKKSVQLKTQYAETKNDKALSNDVKKDLLSDLQKGYQKINSEKQVILNKADIRKETRAVEAGAKTIFKGKTKVKRLGDSVEVEQWLVENRDKYSDLSSSKKTNKQLADNYGFIAKDKNTGESIIIINESGSAEDGIITTGRHEFLHNLLYASLSDSKTQINLGFQLLKELKAKTDGGKTLSNKFKERIAQYATSRVEIGGVPVSNADALLSVETLGDLTQYLSTHLRTSDNKINPVQFEELLTLTAEALSSKDLVLNESLLTQFADVIKRIYRDLFNKNIKFDTGKDVLSFLKDYNKSIDNGGVFSKRFENLAEKGATGKLTEPGLLGGVSFRSEAGTKLSLTSNGLKESVSNKDLKDTFDAFDQVELGNKDNNNKFKTPEEFRDSDEFWDVYFAVTDPDSRVLDGYLIQKAGVEFNSESQKLDFIEAAKENLGKRLERGNFNPSKNSLFGWMFGSNGIVGKVILDVKKAYVKDATRGGRSIDTAAGEAGAMSELMAEETAEDTIDLEERAKEQEVALGKKPTFLETLPVNDKVNATETFKEVLTKELGERVKRNVQLYDQKISQNRTITPFIAELRQDMSDNFYKQTKKFINDYKGGYDGFLIDFKETLLNNYTTTYLSKHPIFRKGILKRVNGKWVAPTKVLVNGNFKYEWVDSNGKKLKIDRDNAAGRGLTSGPEFIKRNPNINNVLSTNEFVDYHFQDGALRKKKKQNPEDAVARQIATETALEIFQEDLLSNGPITKLFEDRAELLDKVIDDSTAISIVRDIDRGNIKFSIKPTGLAALPFDDKIKLIGTDFEGTKLTKAVRGLSNIVDRAILVDYEKNYGLRTKAYKDLVYEKVGNIIDKNYDLSKFSHKNARDIIVKAISETFISFSKAKAKISPDTHKLRKPGMSWKQYISEGVWSSLGSVESTRKFLGISKGLSLDQKSSNAGEAKRIMASVYNHIMATNGNNQLESASTVVRLLSRAFASGSSSSMLGVQENVYASLSEAMGRDANGKPLIERYFKLVDTSKGKSIRRLDGKSLKPKHVNYSTKEASIQRAIKTTDPALINVDMFNNASSANKKIMIELTEVLRQMYNTGSLSNYDLGLIFGALSNTMSSPLKAMAPVRHMAISPTSSKSYKKWTFEHSVPTNYMARAIMASIIDPSQSNRDFVNELVKEYTVAIIPDTMANTVDAVHKNNMTIGYVPGETLLPRYTNEGVAYSGSIKPLYDLKTGKVVLSEYTSVNNKEQAAALVRINNKNYNNLKTFLDTEKQTFYNGSPLPANKLGQRSGVVHLATDIREAQAYADSNGGKVREFNIDPKIIKPESTILKEIKALKLKPKDQEYSLEESSTYEIIDERFDGSLSQADINTLFDSLRSKGIKAIEYEDGTQVVGGDTKSVLVIDLSLIEDTSNLKFSKSMKAEFDEMLSGATGFDIDDIISNARAKTLGKKRNNSSVFVPNSHEDFLGLMYPLLAKGKKGDEQLAFIKKTLVNPFGRAEYSITKERVSTALDFKALKQKLNKELGRKGLSKLLKQEAWGGFTNEQALRVWLWSSQSMDVPGLNENDIKRLKGAVLKNKTLVKYGINIKRLLKGGQYPAPKSGWEGSNISYDIQQDLEGTRREFYLKEWQENVDALFTPENMNKLEAAFGESYIVALKSMLHSMKTGRNRSITGSKIEQNLVTYLNGSVAAIMALNMKSAVLQQLSNVNFINWTDNNPLKAAAAFANQPQYWRDVIDILNSDYLVNRRSGLKINVTESELAEAANSSNKITAFIGLMGRKGFVLTQYGDSFAIATGGAAFYRNRINTYLKEVDADGNKLYTKQQAMDKATFDFIEISEDNQQSSRTDKIGMQQASVAGRLFLAFANTPSQYARLTKKAALDLRDGRGDAKTNISKIIYYGFVQNLYFTFLQKGLFSLLFDDEDDDEPVDEELLSIKQRQAFDLANGAFDSTLRGAGGIYGAVFSAVKNTLVKAYDESKKNRTNYKALSYELIDAAPPIASKLQKLSSAGAAFDYNKWEIKNRGMALNNPAIKAGAHFITGVTTVPLDRLVVKAENIKNALNSDFETWQRVASVLGYQGYEIGITDPALAAEALVKSEEQKAAAETKRQAKQKEEVIRKANLSPEELLREQEAATNKSRKSSEKAKATKERNKRIADSIQTVKMSQMTPEELTVYQKQLDEIELNKSLKRKASAKRAAATRKKNKRTKDSMAIVDFFNKKYKNKVNNK
jgi:hypothetical protein